MSNFKDVGTFHHKFGLDHVECQRNIEHDRGVPALPGPRNVSRELIEFRLKFLLEELREFGEAHGYELGELHDGSIEFMRNVNHYNLNRGVDHEKSFDSLLDLAYVVFGTAHVLGYPWQQGWNEVQRANMEKERCVKAEDSSRGSTFDVVKPKGWQPPNIKAVLRAFLFNV